MDLVCEERLSDSPFIERVWHSQGEQAVEFISMAEIHYSMVVTEIQGKRIMTVRGPETRATPAYGPSDSEFVGILFKPGAFIPHLPPAMVMDRHDVNLPEGTRKKFWLHGSTWQFPDFENAETFVDWLARDGLIVHDPLVDTVLRGQPVEMTLRNVQRRFLQATGLTQGLYYQIERARYAIRLLKQGISILDTVEMAGYFDQPHLTRSLKRFSGKTPAQILDKNRTERLSFLYKTEPLLLPYDSEVVSTTKGELTWEQNLRSLA